MFARAIELARCVAPGVVGVRLELGFQRESSRSMFFHKSLRLGSKVLDNATLLMLQLAGFMSPTYHEAKTTGLLG